MKIKNIEIQNYKAFREVDRFEIDGKNVLIYGNNGSGKTSLASALQAVIQSSVKSQEQINQVFDRRNDESIVNIDTPDKEETFVKVTTDSGVSFRYAINGNTCSDETLQKANQVSDFINYRLLFRFFNFRETQNADIFPIIQDEFFPFWTDPARAETYQDWINNIVSSLAEMRNDKVKSNSSRYWAVYNQLIEFNNAIERQISNLIEPTNTFLRIILAPEKTIEVSFRFQQGYMLDPKNKFVLISPIISLAINYDGKPINRPHTFLNEARLTALALAIRFAAFQTRPKGVSDFKILILDDLLISLDMCLRMKVIDILLDSYDDYQFFIFTHDKGFYNFLRQKLIIEENSWECLEMYEKTEEGKFRKPFIHNDLDYLQRAEYYLDINHKDLEVSALYLRKKAEALIHIFYDQDLENFTRFVVLEKLATALNEAKNKRDRAALDSFQKFLQSSQKEENTIDLLLAESFQGDGTLKPQQIHAINNFRIQVLKFIKEYDQQCKNHSAEYEELMGLIKKINQARAIVMNPGAHQGDIPIYEQELIDALTALKAFQKKIKDKALYT